MESFFRFRLLISPAEQNTRVAEQTLKVKNLNSGGGGPYCVNVRLVHLAFPIHCSVYGIGVAV
jgi:hypothetical protein